MMNTGRLPVKMIWSQHSQMNHDSIQSIWHFYAYLDLYYLTALSVYKVNAAKEVAVELQARKLIVTFYFKIVQSK